VHWAEEVSTGHLGCIAGPRLNVVSEIYCCHVILFFFCDFGSLVEVSKLPCGLHSCSVFQSSVVVAASRFEALYVFSAVDYDKAFDTWNLVFRNPK